MTKTQRKRLLKLADFIVEKVPKDQFNMGIYGGLSVLDRPLSINQHACGSAACALGWSTVLFKKLGVAFVDGVPKYKDRKGYGVGVPLFGLDFNQSETLFTGEKAGRSAKQVRQDILRMVARLDKEQKPVYSFVGNGSPALVTKAHRNGWKLFSFSTGAGEMTDGWCGDSWARKYYIKKP